MRYLWTRKFEGEAGYQEERSRDLCVVVMGSNCKCLIIQVLEVGTGDLRRMSAIDSIFSFSIGIAFKSFAPPGNQGAPGRSWNHASFGLSSLSTFITLSLASLRFQESNICELATPCLVLSYFVFSNACSFNILSLSYERMSIPCLGYYFFLWTLERENTILSKSCFVCLSSLWPISFSFLLFVNIKNLAKGLRVEFVFFSTAMPYVIAVAWFGFTFFGWLVLLWLFWVGCLYGTFVDVHLDIFFPLGCLRLRSNIFLVFLPSIKSQPIMFEATMPSSAVWSSPTDSRHVGDSYDLVLDLSSLICPEWPSTPHFRRMKDLLSDHTPFQR